MPTSDRWPCLSARVLAGAVQARERPPASCVSNPERRAQSTPRRSSILMMGSAGELVDWRPSTKWPEPTAIDSGLSQP